jgi:hypothetical protein
MFVEYINHRHLVFISLRSSENGTERNGTGNLLLTWFSCPYPVEENAFPLVYRKFALDYRLCTFKQVWTWYSWFMFLFIPALGSSSSSCFFSLVYIKVVSISDSRTRLKWIRPLKTPPRWGGCRGARKHLIRIRRSFKSFTFPPRRSYSQKCVLIQP